MAHHQASPGSAIMPHHRLPTAPIQPNGGQPPYAAAPPRFAGSPAEHLQQLNEVTWIAIGKFAEAVGSKDTALFSYRRALSFNPDSLEALQLQAAVLRSMDQFPEAVEFLQRIIRLDSHNGEAWSNLGHCFLMMDELQQAYSSYQSALYNLPDPKEPKLWYGIGILYDRYGSLDHAEEAFSQVMRMAPNFDKANEIYFRLGIIYKQQGKFDASLECFRYISENPPAPLSKTDIWFQIGHVYEQQKDYGAAKNAYRKVLEHDEHHAKVLQQLGWLHHQESNDFGSQEQAIEYLEKSVSSDQTDAQSWYLLGRCYMSQQKFPKAYEAYQQAVYRDGRNPTFWCSIGVLYYQINQYRDALDAYSRAIRLNPNISEVWYDLGTLYESCNNQTNDALDAYQRAAELDPNNQHIKARLQLLRSGPSSGMPNQSVTPLPQDVHPQAYQSNLNGPPQPQWNSMPQSQAPPGQGPPPPPLNARDWPRPGDVHGAPPPGQGPHGPPYDARDPVRGYPPTSHPSPHIDSLRHEQSHRPTPSMHRAPSPPPHVRDSVPSVFRTPQSVPPPGPSGAQGSQQGSAPRVSNPNYGASMGPAPPHPAGPYPPGPQPPYAGGPGASPAPPPEIRPLNDPRPKSPRGTSYSVSQSGHHSASNSFSYRPDSSSQPSIASGAPPPMSAVQAAEAAARERDVRSSAGPKRYREWEDEGQHKKQTTDDNRAKLQDSGFRRTETPPRPSSMYGPRENGGPFPHPGPTSAAHSAGSSPEAMRREEDQRRAAESYRPSEAAHHPPQLNPVNQPDPPHQQLPPMNMAQKQESISPKREDPPPKPDHDRTAGPPLQPEHPRDRDGDVRMHAEEPAARKMEVNENYDSDSAEEEAKSAAKPATANHNETSKAGGSMPASRLTSPRAGSAGATNGQSNGMANGANAEARVEA